MTKLSRERKIDILSKLYNIDSNRKAFDFDFEKESDYSIDWFYDTFGPGNNEDYYYSPLGEGVEVKEYAPLKLDTFYPLVHPYYQGDKDSKYKWTGHSQVNTPFGTKDFDDYDYNLITNNCSDASREVLENVFGIKSNIKGFTTPGDVRDFALQNGGYSKDLYNREIIIPMNEQRYKRLKTFIDNKIKEERKRRGYE